MKRTVSLLLTAIVVLSLSSSALADCGKMIIIPIPPPRPCPPKVTVWKRTLVVTETVTKVERFGGHGHYQPDLFQPHAYNEYTPGQMEYVPGETNLNANTNTNTNTNTVNVNVGPRPEYLGVNNDGNVQLPPVTDTYTSNVEYGDGLFKEGDQQGLVAWNGKEEILVLSTNEVSKVGAAAMLSVMPLPGKPISIQRANKEIFNKATKLINDKLKADGVEYGLFMKTEIGAHKIFVWEIDNITKFEDEVNAFIAETYGAKNSVLFDKKTKAAIEDYFKRGFKYFAFDLTLVGDKGVSTKEAIAYHYESKFAFFPTVISASGGSGKTKIKLAVFSAGGLSKFGGLEPGDGTGDYEIYIPGKKSVNVSPAELKELDPALDKLFDGKGAQGRLFIVTGELDKFKKDIIAY